MMKCNVSLPDPFGVDVSAGSVHAGTVSGVASLADAISTVLQTSGTSLEWQSLITEGRHHFTETKVHSIGFFFPLLFVCSVLSVISTTSFY